MEGQVYVIKAVWDTDASVWVATSEGIPGLVAEADTAEGLLDELRILIPELLGAKALSDSGVPGIPIHIMSERLEHIRL